MTESRQLPNYPAYIILLLMLSPLIILEFDPSIAWSSSFYLKLKEYFGFFMFFQIVLFGFVFAKSIIHYDEIPKGHQKVIIFTSLFFGMALVSLFIAYLGYFNGGLNIFMWLNPG